MEDRLRYVVTINEVNKRLDTVIPTLTKELSRSALKSRAIGIFVNGKVEKLSYGVRLGDVIEVVIPEVITTDLVPQKLDFEILYCDNDIAIVNKPAGLAVHPSTGHPDQTLVNGLLYALGGKLSSIGGVLRPGIVHRLDKDTSGLLIIALHDEAHRKLSDDFKAHRVKKIYHAIVKGHPEPSGQIETGIARSTKDRKKMAVCPEGKHALTHYQVLENLREHAYLEVNILTGRTHQIRVHLSHIGHPIAADPIYSRNAKSYGMKGIALCAKRLEFRHPISGQEMRFEIDLPAEMRDLQCRLRV